MVNTNKTVLVSGATGRQPPPRRFKSQVNTMMVAELSFRKLEAPHLVEKVARGTKYNNGEEVKVKVAA
jgi:hypothetical protein